jgi:hypothetical protein
MSVSLHKDNQPIYVVVVPAGNWQIKVMINFISVHIVLSYQCRGNQKMVSLKFGPFRVRPQKSDMGFIKRSFLSYCRNILILLSVWKMTGIREVFSARRILERSVN